MAISRASRSYKQKMGQFMTPQSLSTYLLQEETFGLNSTVFEPSFGEGAFLFSYIDRMLELYPQVDKSFFVSKLLKENIYGVEMDAELFALTVSELGRVYNLDEGFAHNLVISDFFDYDLLDESKFDYVIGNPPFGGTFEHSDIDSLDRRYGFWNGYKIKKETYAFFISKCVRLMKTDAKIIFILSDTFLTIKTMEGLRRLLVGSGSVSLKRVQFFSGETEWGMIALELSNKVVGESLIFDADEVSLEKLERIPGFPFSASKEVIKIYKNSTTLKDFITASSGMTIGKNEYFVRAVTDGKIVEPFDFLFVDSLITLDSERLRYRHGKISALKEKEILDKEQQGETKITLQVTKKKLASDILLSENTDYLPYNKSNPKELYYTHATSVVFWKNDGEAVLTYKKQGAWYLHGVGGKPFFKREGFTWPLISSKIKAKYLPSGFILDSGAPVAVLNEGIERDELFFIMAWLWTPLATRILKESINHTRNIQGKDVERLPYPQWVSDKKKLKIIKRTKEVVELAKNGEMKKAGVMASTLDKYFNME